jgi:hypothetical protein
MTQDNRIKFNLDNWHGKDLKNSWLGRYTYFFAICNPEKCFKSGDEIQKMNAETKALYKDRVGADGCGMLTQQEIDDYKYKKYVLAASINPDNEETVMWPARVSSFIPTNYMIIAPMLLSAPTVFNTVFWQWVNFTYIASLNYGNRNASAPQTNADIAKSYVLATIAAMTLALSMRVASDKMLAGKTGVMATLSTNIIACTATAVAGGANVYIFRTPEMEKGISLKDEKTGDIIGPRSKIAANEAVERTVKSRAFGCLPLFFISPAWNAAVTAAGAMPKSKVPRTMVELIGIGFGLLATMPANAGFYPQISDIEVSRLEPEIQEAAKARGITSL